VRLEKPSIVVETGVEHGISSWMLLAAMERNQKGELHSIDLPNHEAVVDSLDRLQRNILPSGHQPGWLIPESLRKRWKLYLGDAKILLPEVMETLKEVDIFIHDSLHSYEHMMFEYKTAWPYLRQNGLLLSDDIGWNSAFADFNRQVNRKSVVFREPAGAVFKERFGVLPK
jgi:hypothetical protein